MTGSLPTISAAWSFRHSLPAMAISSTGFPGRKRNKPPGLPGVKPGPSRPRARWTAARPTARAWRTGGRDPDRGRASLGTGPARTPTASYGAWPDYEIVTCPNRLRLRTGAGHTWTASRGRPPVGGLPRSCPSANGLHLVDYDEAPTEPMLTL
jgi:hypothetical protein